MTSVGCCYMPAEPVFWLTGLLVFLNLATLVISYKNLPPRAKDRVLAVVLFGAAALLSVLIFALLWAAFALLLEKFA